MAKFLTILKLLALPKGYDYAVNAYLHASEIDCKCNRDTCHYTLAHPRALNSFYTVRLAMGLPLRINSFFRCQAHNASPEVGGKPHSSHTSGMALDISFRNLPPPEVQKLISLCNEHFDFIKIYETFIHCQINE
jgi:hypothetical protein